MDHTYILLLFSVFLLVTSLFCPKSTFVNYYLILADLCDDSQQLAASYCQYSIVSVFDLN